jgi:hypothetical protein
MVGMFGCSDSVVETFKGELQSDGYISFSASGTIVTIADSVLPGDPSIECLRGEYDRVDSILSIRGYSHSASISLWITNCADTGMFALASDGLSLKQSSASVNAYQTDSLSHGNFHLTRLDTNAGRIRGTFEFTARKNGGTASDTLRITQGVVFDFPVHIY